METAPEAELLREHVQPLDEQALARLADDLGKFPVVLIGEATHGTEEFYRIRAELTRRLVADKGFLAVAVEADWPDALRVNRYVRAGQGEDAEGALADFKRFPAWMWRNTEVRDFVEWLRGYNQNLPAGRERVGFYGLDLYSLYSSAEAVLAYLDQVDPAAASRARYRYACFEHFAEDTQAYGYAAAFGLGPTCERDVLSQLVELQGKAGRYLRADGRWADDEQFFAEQNARVVVNAEEYYRSMFGGRISSWNLRDEHMADTLHFLRSYLEKLGHEPRVVVWEHNSHIGDARATRLGQAGELNVGQLARERYGEEVRLVGFTTYAGTVTAASAWGGPAERKRVRAALPGSYEKLFHAVGLPAFVADLRAPELRRLLPRQRLERAIGVVYLPESERLSHYFHACLADQFDTVIYLDETHALRPLEVQAGWERGKLPETYPSGV